MAAPSIVELVEQAGEVFRPEAIPLFFFTAYAELDGKRPIDLLDAASGRAKVSDYLYALAHVEGRTEPETAE